MPHQYDGATAGRLRDELRARGLPSSYNRDRLIGMLRQDDARRGGPVVDKPEGGKPEHLGVVGKPVGEYPARPGGGMFATTKDAENYIRAAFQAEGSRQMYVSLSYPQVDKYGDRQYDRAGNLK